MKSRLSVPVAVLLAALALFVVGCGDSESSSSDEPASIAPPQSPLFIEGTVSPSGQLKADVDQIASTVAGVDNLGDLIVSELESSADEEDESFDFDKEVKPWLGKRGAVFFERFDGDDFTEYGLALESTDTEATQAFIDTQVEDSNDPVEDGSYEGVDYWVDTGDDSVIGLIGNFFVQAEGKQSFEHAVDASEGDSLADEDDYNEAIADAEKGSLADVYVDVGALIEQGEEEVDEGVLRALKSAGIDPREATAVASIVPGSDQVEIDISSDTGEQEAPTGDASELLGSLPGNAFAAFAVSGFGEQLEEVIDELDKTGIPGEIPPGKLKDGAKELGFDLDNVAASLEDAGLFASGSSESDIGGAFVLTTDDSSEVSTVVRVIGGLIRQTDTPGVTALSGEASGFSVRDPEELGPQPLVVATKGDRVAIGYGVKQTLLALTANGGSTLSSTPNYKDAVAALGSTSITGFVDGDGALRLADSFVPSSEAEFEEAKRYLKAIRFIALGSGSEGERVTAKLIVGLQK